MRSDILRYLTFCICLLHFSATCRGEGLKCYLCLSNKSWENCEKTKIAARCRQGHDEVCVKQYMIEHSKDRENGYKETFLKMCGQANLCTNKGCKEHRKTCQVDCCHSDFCNSAARPTAREPIILLGFLLMIFLYILQLRCV